MGIIELLEKSVGYLLRIFMKRNFATNIAFNRRLKKIKEYHRKFVNRIGFFSFYFDKSYISKKF